MKRLAVYGALMVILLGGAWIFLAGQDQPPPIAESSAPLQPAAPQPAQQQEGKLVLAFGDSLTAGYGLSANQSFPAQLEAALKASGLNARVHNGGVSGDTTAVGRGRLDWVIDSLKAEPDLVIVELGGNDMLRGLGPDQTLANLDAMITALKKRDIPVLLAGMRASPNLGKVYQTEFDAIYPALAKRHNVALYPFFMDGVAAQLPLLQGDGIHPNAKGVEIIVGKIVPVVKAALDK